MHRAVRRRVASCHVVARPAKASASSPQDRGWLQPRSAVHDLGGTSRPIASGAVYDAEARATRLSGRSPGCTPRSRRRHLDGVKFFARDHRAPAMRITPRHRDRLADAMAAGFHGRHTGVRPVASGTTGGSGVGRSGPGLGRDDCNRMAGLPSATSDSSRSALRRAPAPPKPGRGASSLTADLGEHQLLVLIAGSAGGGACDDGRAGTGVTVDHAAPRSGEGPPHRPVGAADAVPPASQGRHAGRRSAGGSATCRRARRHRPVPLVLDLHGTRRRDHPAALAWARSATRGFVTVTPQGEGGRPWDDARLADLAFLGEVLMPPSTSCASINRVYDRA